MANNYLINSLRKGLLILQCFNPRKPKLSMSEICQLTSLSKATVFRLLKTLSELNYLKYEFQNRKYYLGPAVLSLGFSVLKSMEIREIARPYLDRLSNEIRKTVNLGILDKEEMVYIDRIRFPDIRDLNITIGSRIPVYNTALGKVVLAYQDNERLIEILKSLKKDSKAIPYIGKDGEILIKMLENVRKDGFATDDEEFSKGIRAIAVPLFSSDVVNYGINIVGSSDTLSIDELKSAYAPILIKVGIEISTMLGWEAIS